MEDHVARAVDGDLLRAAHTRCRQCGFLRTVWFRVAPRLVNERASTEGRRIARLNRRAWGLF